MSSSHYSELGAVLAVVALLAVAATPAAAVSVSGDEPSTAQVGEQQSTTFEVAEPFSDYEEWTLRAETDLENVTWTIQTFDNAGNQVDEETLTGQAIEYDFDAATAVTRADVQIEGTTPGTETFQWSYDPEQTVTYASFEQTQRGGSTSQIGSAFETRPYTTDSREARRAIDDAEAAVERATDAGGSVTGAERDVRDAIEFYNAGEFNQAVTNANEAESAASSAQSSAKRTQLLMYGGAAVVVLLVLGGLGYWYLQQRDTYDKLG
ncbi:hypothetical protein KI372_09060 [Halobacterium salinarum]|uniref:hypothetical protein n=1 Tax=Halobacterium salinarum TaxID=2242 RepID=UPI001F1B0B14|nr:hypothetical protein [Halobacterium salinarum]MCF2208312.1 hypothetical protein [Halobacterium salinarum]MCF2241500.1 hypothetical protein [Halobacterium salinarum]